MKTKSFIILAYLIFYSTVASAELKEYNLTIGYQDVNISGHNVEAMTINNSIPGPTLRFKIGDRARISVKNEMDVETSIHWHGILLPNFQDGVPYVTTPPIMPGETFTYEFPIVHSGTYWYHSHTGLQEQRGVFGSIVIEPEAEPYKTDIDHVVVISDWTDENPDEILRTLKSGSEFYSLKKGSVQSLTGAIKEKALSEVINRELMRMPPMDISDVAYESFITNGSPASSLEASAGQTIRLRIINAAASTYFYLQFAGGHMKVVSADGVDVQPVHMDRFLIAIAETYDVIVTVPDNRAYEFRATAQDGSGHTSLYIGKGQKVPAPDVPKPNLYKMHGSEHSSQTSGMKGMGHESGTMQMSMDMLMNTRPMPPYNSLKSPGSTALDNSLPIREIRLELEGDMERYVWTINGKTLSEADVIKIKKGENVRFVLINKTMMHHPMHLHGHFFRVVNKHGDYSPLKHTVDVPPLGTTVMVFYADEEKDWFFHCHLLYHMKAGMARIVHYEGDELDPRIEPIRSQLFKEHWYAWGNASILTQMTEGEVVAADTRNTLRGAWEAGWDEDYEAVLTYARYFSRFFQIFAGAVITDGEQEDRGIIGIHYLLPLMLESAVWLDTEGDLRLNIDREIQVTDRLHLFGEFQYDTDSNEEWAAGAGWTINRYLTITGQYHSEYRGGAGINIRY